MEAKIFWKSGLAFEANSRGHKIVLDATPEVGGQNLGMTPKELVLNGMLGCTGMDVASLLKKMRSEPTNFWLSSRAEKTEGHPSYFSFIHLIYHLEGEVDPDKAIKAVTMSMTRYCGVSYMISQSAEISYEIEINGKIIHTGKADFTPSVGAQS